MTGHSAAIDHDTALDAMEIRKILSEHHLPVRDVHYHARGMITAVQPLTMGNDEICTDTILAEHVTYPNRDTLTRETETLTLKKSSFSDFEPSMTPIPKYCFTSTTASKCVLVHSVSRCTLDKILNWIEQQYRDPYPCNRMRFYTDWLKLITHRVRSSTPEGEFRRLRGILHLPKAVFPAPLHISLKQRESFAAYLLHSVNRHHKKGIHHDCITDKTVFFTGPYQPLFLANYAGVPSAVLSDHLPPELLEASATDRFGPHFRDVYSLSLLCYRILTGERHDGRAFLLQSPRPTMVVLRELARNNELSFCFRSFSKAVHTFAALFGTTRDSIHALLQLFLPSSFTAWRRLNRATGGLWRQLPLFGPFCDIYSPTIIAQSLRCVLDKHWVGYRRNTGRTADEAANPQGVTLPFLLPIFSIRHQISYPQYTDAFTALADDTDERRSAFGYVMEVHGTSKRLLKSLFRLQTVLPAGVAAILTMLGFFLFVNHDNDTANRTTASIVDNAISATELVRSTPVPQRKTVVTGKESTHVATTEADTVSLTQTGKDTGTIVNERIEPKKSTSSHSAHTTRRLMKKKGSATPQLAGKLNPALGFKDIYVAIGIKDSCNPGELSYPATGNKTVPLGSLSPPRLKLYMVRRTAGGFSPIHTIWLCRTGKCKKTFYYRSTGRGRTSRWAFAGTGDAVGGNRSEMERFVQLRKSLMRK